MVQITPEEETLEYKLKTRTVEEIKQMVRDLTRELIHLEEERWEMGMGVDA